MAVPLLVGTSNKYLGVVTTPNKLKFSNRPCLYPIVSMTLLACAIANSRFDTVILVAVVAAVIVVVAIGEEEEGPV